MTHVFNFFGPSRFPNPAENAEAKSAPGGEAKQAEFAIHFYCAPDRVNYLQWLQAPDGAGGKRGEFSRVTCEKSRLALPEHQRRTKKTGQNLREQGLPSGMLFVVRIRSCGLLQISVGIENKFLRRA